MVVVIGGEIVCLVEVLMEQIHDDSRVSVE